MNPYTPPRRGIKGGGMLCVCQSVQGSVEARLSLELRPAGTRDEVVSLYWVILQSVQCAKVLPLDPRTVPWSWRESTKVAVSPLDPILSPQLQLWRPADCMCVCVCVCLCVCVSRVLSRHSSRLSLASTEP